MSLLASFCRATKNRRCPICGKHNWCMHGLAGSEFEGATICSRIESAHRFGQAGWLHRSESHCRGSRRQPDRILPVLTSLQASSALARLVEQAKQALTPASQRTLSTHLQVGPLSLEQLAVGLVSTELAREARLPWAADSWTFPMRNAERGVVGIRLRKPDGTKLSWPGGREGLFLPADLKGDPILLCEGPSDTAAALDLGFAAIGRPSCMGGCRELVEFLWKHSRASVVVISDQDTPGRRGALNLARALARHVAGVRVVAPPPGIKDLRAWVIDGASHDDVQMQINAAQPFEVRLLGARSARHG